MLFFLVEFLHECLGSLDVADILLLDVFGQLQLGGGVKSIEIDRRQRFALTF